ncbi:MAG: MBL fold metallo-hydrolase [bacterium]|nr:MBL fold metallo-hydrolase [bacterium]
MNKYRRRLLAIVTSMMMLVLAGCTAVNEQNVQSSQSPLNVVEATDNASTTQKVTKEPQKTTQQPQKVTELPKKETSDSSASNLEVHFIDVGQGDCILLRSDNQTMLIDAGDNNYGKGVVTYLSNLGIKKLDYLVGTHPDADHIGGLDNVISSLDIGKIYMPKKQSNTKTFEDVLTAIAKKGLKVSSPKVGDTFTLGSANISVLGPINTYEDNNNNSIVLKVTHGKNSFLLTGDAELEAEEDMVASGEDLSATVLKVGHHGSHSSTSRSLLDKVNPTYAVISCGVDNKYGHPHTETMTYLKRYNVTVYRTDQQKTIVMTSDGKKITTKTGEPSVAASKSYSSSSSGSYSDKNSVSNKKDPIPTKAPVSGSYIGNTNTKKFHNADCSSLPKKENQIMFSSREEAIAAGYEPCKRCNP